MIDEILQGKFCMILLNKFDFVDVKVIQEWIVYFKNEGIIVFFVDVFIGINVKDILVQVWLFFKEKIDCQLVKGINLCVVCVFIVGIFNVGKFILINWFVG